MNTDLDTIRKKWCLTFDYHTHTIYSHMGPYRHAKGQVMDNVRVAAERGLKEIAITDHGPGHRFYGISMRDIPKVRRDIEEAQKSFPGVKIWLGVEANIVANKPNGLDVKPEWFDQFDFVNCGYHYGLPGCHMPRNMIDSKFGRPSGSREHLRAINTEMTVNALESNKIRILTHPGDKGPFDIAVIARTCEEQGIWMEINARHTHMTVEDLKVAGKFDVSFVISSDAHRPEHVGRYAASVVRAIEGGIDPGRIVNLREREEDL